jgi:hypothetical protein
VRTFLAELLATNELPFDVRINTSESRKGGGIDLPDVAFYDGGGKFLVVCGEVKLPTAEIDAMAISTERNDQIGRYLAATRAVLLCNVRAFGLLTVDPRWKAAGPVPPEDRRIERVVELWPSVASLKQGEVIEGETVEALSELVETTVTRYAPIVEPESLARILARQAREAKEDLPEKFTQAVQGLLDDFGKALGVTFVGDEGEEFLRSSLIQTAFYGLFAGWALWWQGGREKPFKWEELADYLKIPFLGSLFYEFRHPSRIKELRLAKHLDIAEETVGRVDGQAFFERFRLPTLNRDDEAATTAIMHFYEPFLEAFDPTLRKELGVWYTPAEVVRYQVAKIDRLLREELGCERGFADDGVVVLDPCCGTGAYLVEALRHVASQLEGEGAGATIGARLLNAVCQRFIGFEILTAPFVVAQLQLYLLLSKVGAAPDERHRPAILLTNALTGWDGPDQLKLNFPELQEEHDAAQGVKSDAKVIVVLGNPPYNRFAGVPLKEEASLVDHYKGIHRDEKGRQLGQSELFTRWGVRKQLLDDLYVRFFRLAEVRIGEKAEFGVVSYISNSSFLTGRSHPIMRESLIHIFQEIWVDNLNGDKYKTGKVIPKGLPEEGTADQSIFSTDHDPRGIQVGTCVTTYLKRIPREREKKEVAKLNYRDFWGRAAGKRTALLESLEMEAWMKRKSQTAANTPAGPRPYRVIETTSSSRWLFAPRSYGPSYEDWPSIEELLPTTYQGVNPNRGIEGSVVEMDKRALEARMRDYFSAMSFSELKRRHPVLCEDRARYDAKATREKLRGAHGFDGRKIVPYILFPFDVRWIYYEREAKFLNECRADLFDNLGGNEFLIGVPQARKVSESRPILTAGLFDLHLHDRGSVGVPASIKPEPHDGGLFKPKANDLKPSANIALPSWQAFQGAWKLKGDLRGDDAHRLSHALLRVCLCISHAPQYEADNKESLAYDWARIPLPRTRKLLNEIAVLGEQVHVLLDPFANPAKTVRELLGKDATALAVVRSATGKTVKECDLRVSYNYYGAAKGKWQARPLAAEEALRTEWGSTTGDLYLSEGVFLSNVPEQVWHYELGGYPVVKKWLGGRDAGRREGTLTLAELDLLRAMVVRIAALLSLRPTLDQAYERATADAFSLEELGLAGSMKQAVAN